MTLTSDLVSRTTGIKSGSNLLFFEAGIPKLVCGFIYGWRSVTYHFWVTVTLSSDLLSGIIVSYFNPKFGVWMHLGMMKCHVPIFGSL